MRHFFSLWILLASITLSSSQELSFMSYNIRYDNPNDGENRWDNRKEFLMSQVKFFEPTIMGVQEALKHQLDFLDAGLTSYAYFGVGRDDGKEKGEYTAVFYKKETLKLIKQSTFWLSKTPDEISKGWDAALERICTYGLFEDKSDGKKFWVFNTHFDHRGEKAREKSAKLILKKIKEFNTANYPVILMGDLNLTPETHAIKVFSDKMQDARHAATSVAFGPDGTFTGFKHDKIPDRRIDYIFCSKGNIEIEKYAILTDSQGLRYPSDHFPVYVQLHWK